MAGYFWDQLYVDKMKRNRKIKFRVVQMIKIIIDWKRGIGIWWSQLTDGIIQYAQFPSIDRSIDRNEAEGKGREATPFARSDLG